MTGKHVKEKIEGSSCPCCFSKYARSSCDFSIQRIDSEKPWYILKENNEFQQILGVQRSCSFQVGNNDENCNLGMFQDDQIQRTFLINKQS